MSKRLLTFSVAALACVGGSGLSAQAGRSGAELYRAGCAACHGDDGRGAPREQTGFDARLPDFADCAFASQEPNRDWASVIRWGGPVRAFDRLMPAFGDALTGEDIDRLVGYYQQMAPGSGVILARATATR